MMRAGSGILLIAIAALSPAFAAIGILTDDTSISVLRPADNFGALPSMQVGGGSTALVRFSLAALPASVIPSQIVKATLILYANKVETPGRVAISAVGGPWSERTVVFQGAPVTSAASDTAQVNRGDEFVVADVTEIVQGWVAVPANNNGLHIASASDTPGVLAQFDTKESTGTGHQAMLEITLMAAGPMGPPGPAGPAGIAATTSGSVPKRATALSAPAATAGVTGASHMSGHKTMVIGDSIAGGFNSDEPFPNIAPVWFAQAVVQSKSAIRYLGNAGVLADGTTDMLSRLQTDVISKNPDKVFIVAGFSDIDFLPPVSAVIGNITAIVDQLKAANILPILCTLPPKPPIDVNGKTNPAVSQELVVVNLFIRNLADQEGVPLVDFYKLLVDPVTGQYKSGYSPDGNHPQMPASKLMAQEAVAATRNLYDAVSPWLAAVDGDGINLIQDPLFLQTPGRWTVAMAAGSPGQTPMNTAIASDAAISGNAITMMNTDAQSVSTLNGATITTGFKAGDKLAFSGRIKSLNCESGNMAFDVGLVFTNVNYGLNSRNTTNAFFKWSVDIPDGQWYMELTVPPAVDATKPMSITPVITLNSLLIPDVLTLIPGTVNGGGTGTVTVGQIGLLNLTALGL